MQWTRVPGVLVKGYRVASGPSTDYPYGALDRQRPIITPRGLDLNAHFNGTLNIDIDPYTFELVRPEYTFRNVEWTDLHPPERCSFHNAKSCLITSNMKVGSIIPIRKQNCATFRIPQMNWMCPYPEEILITKT